MRSTLRSILVLSLAVTAIAKADIVTQWNFNSNPSDGNPNTGTLTPNIGTGTASLVGGTTATFASGDASGGSSDPATGDDSGWNTTTYPAQGTGDRTRGVQFSASTAGFENITINWDQRHSNTSARHVQFQYSLDGTTFTDFGTLFQGTAGDTWFNNRTIDLSSIAGANNNANFAFRMVAAFDPATSLYAPSNSGSTYGTTGTWRFDMVTLNGTASVPEPGTLLLAGVTALVAGGARLMRRRGASETVAA
jgi:hypothetical protein